MKRKFIGGDLQHSSVFEKILSIGYEFETHELSKFSLTKDGKTLVNTDLNMRRFIEKPVDKHSYRIRSPPKRGTAKVEVDEFVHVFFEEDENIKLSIINDIGYSDFEPTLKSACSTHEERVSKSKMYSYKTPDKSYSLDFIMGEENKDCSLFSGVEWLVTYYKPRQNKKIILETFIDASIKLYNHLKNTEIQSGNLFFVYRKKETKLGELEDRPLFHVPSTNLYYLQTYDTDEPLLQKGILDTLVVPQMTFRCSIMDVLDIAKQIVEDVDRAEHKKIQEIEKMVFQLIQKYNASLENPEDKVWRLPATITEEGKKIKGYLFLIYYKLNSYIEYFTGRTDEVDYLKNYLTFSARNTNIEFYIAITNILIEYYREKNPDFEGDIDEKVREILMAVFNQPEIIKRYLYTDKKAVDTVLTVDDEGYGDPSISYISYFNFFDEPSEEAFEREINDWFILKKMEFTTIFPIEDDTVLIENRLFVHELFDLIKQQNIASVKHESNSISLRNLKRFHDFLTGDAQEKVRLTPREDWKGKAPPAAAARGKSKKILLTRRGGKTRRAASRAGSLKGSL